MLLIAGLAALSIFSLFPREETVRQQAADGTIRDTVMKRIPLKLGLDLQGGMHLDLELDESERVSADRDADTQLALTVLRKRVDEFGVSEPVIQKVGDNRIVVELAGIRDPERAKGIVAKAAFLEFRITDKTGALEAALPSMDRVLGQLGVTSEIPEATVPSQLDDLLGEAVSSTAADSSVADSVATVTPSGGPILQSLVQPAAVYGFSYERGPMPGQFAVLETAWIRVDSMLRLPEVSRLLNRDVEIRWARSPESIGAEQVRLMYVVDKEPIITGERLQSAAPQIDPLTNSPVVSFTLDRAGARRFGNETSRHIGDFMAIVLDNRVEGIPPVIQSRIDRNGQITLSGQGINAAQDLALTLNAGALPIPLKIVSEKQVSATLGQESIRGGAIAMIVAVILVILIMISYYRLAGLLAVCALTLYMLFTIAGLAGIGAALTLPGLAGLVLSVGMAVDANVLIFERIREELAAGRSVRLGVNEGFRHAMSAIVDSNVSTIITALFLFQFGTGPVQGFAVTLIVGVTASMFTAIFVTRTFFLLWLERRDAHATTLSI